MEKLIKYKKWIYLGLGLAVLAAALFPLFVLRIDLLGAEASMEFSLRLLFENAGSFGGDFPLADAGGFGQNGFAREIVMPFIAYVVMLVFIIIGTVLAFFDKFKMVVTGLLVAALGLAVYLGFAFTGLPSVLGDMVADMFGNNSLLGFFVSMVDLNEMITVNLGSGYWLTLASIFTVVVVKFVDVIKHKDD